MKTPEQRDAAVQIIKDSHTESIEDRLRAKIRGSVFKISEPALNDIIGIALTILKEAKAEQIEFRPNMDVIDEIVAENVDVHLEYMSDSSIWMSIGNYHIWITAKNGRSHIETRAEFAGSPIKGESNDKG